MTKPSALIYPISQTTTSLERTLLFPDSRCATDDCVAGGGHGLRKDLQISQKPRYHSGSNIATYWIILVSWESTSKVAVLFTKNETSTLYVSNMCVPQ